MAFPIFDPSLSVKSGNYPTSFRQGIILKKSDNSKKKKKKKKTEKKKKEKKTKEREKRNETHNLCLSDQDKL
jgi:hypothetical protein